MRVLSGVQPTGNLHLGNYLGAIKEFVALQDQADECFFSVVDLHAITVKHDPDALMANTREIAAAYVAAGVGKTGDSRIFVQSHVKEFAELSWLLSSIARVGWLNRMTQYREKTNSVPPADLRGILERFERVVKQHDKQAPSDQRQSMFANVEDLRAITEYLSNVTSNSEAASVGLYTYPVLMAADILAFKATHVPVGEDQIQHLNLARDIAQKFNHDYRDIFPIPVPMWAPVGARIMSLKDGTKKMSKSADLDASRINMRDSDDVIAAKIKKATAHSAMFPMDSDELSRIEPDVAYASVANLINIYVACSGESREAVYERFGGKGYGTFKPALADAVIATVAPIRDAMTRLLADKKYIDHILDRDVHYAMTVTEATLRDVKEAMGFLL